MKKIILVATVLLCAYAPGFAQGKIPNNAVIGAFNQKFPEAIDVEWEKENAHEYEAEFEWNNKKYSANFSESGEWLETELELTFDQLPEKVQAAFNASHKGATVKEVEKIETSKGVTKYEVEIKEGLKTVEFVYNEDGTEIKK